jgi:hypothetical protein
MPAAKRTRSTASAEASASPSPPKKARRTPVTNGKSKTPKDEDEEERDHDKDVKPRVKEEDDDDGHDPRFRSVSTAAAEQMENEHFPGEMEQTPIAKLYDSMRALASETGRQAEQGGHRGVLAEVREGCVRLSLL